MMSGFCAEGPPLLRFHHAFPVSFIAMNQTRYDALPDELRVQLDKASLSIEVLNPMGKVA
ncbi:hypothetical protein [Burkholderia ambifaria]|uniref:hypothetical protein n=1 Tax=Burkholderia ambifaria TaxID=152480 RepID=UPI0031FD2189